MSGLAALCKPERDKERRPAIRTEGVGPDFSRTVPETGDSLQLIPEDELYVLLEPDGEGVRDS